MQGRIKHPKHSRRGLTLGAKERGTVGGLKSMISFRKVAIGAAPVFFVAFCAAFAASSILSPINSSDATNVVTANVNSQGYYVKINSSDVTMNILTTPGGVMTVVSSSVKAATNSPNGYKLYLGMSPYTASGTEKSSVDKQKNGLYLDGDLSRTDGEVLNAVGGSATGTLSALTDNTWGYAVDKNNVGAHRTIPDIWKNENHSTMSSSTPTEDKFAAVPTVGHEDLIQTTDQANVSVDTPESSVTENDYTTTNVYYGVRGTMARSSGAYSNTIAYTAVAQAGPDPGSISFTPAVYTRDATYDAMVWDDTVTIQTSLYTNMEDLGTATVTLSGGPENVSNLTCANPVLGTNNNMLTVTCTLPQAYAGKYKVHVSLQKFAQEYDGTYVYAVDTLEHLTAMQEMTKTVCDSATTPSPTASSVPQVFLTDLRGGGGYLQANKYRVRKLADGNCWMTENMDLPQSTSQTYYSYSTNLTTVPDSSLSTSYTNNNGVITWTPTANYITTAGQTDSNKLNDHTYYGNGSAGTRTATTADGETQSIGTYYNWAAATAQSGGDSGEAPNSVCPYGWRLPSGAADGTPKSFATLFGSSAYNYGNDSAGSTNACSYPVSLVSSGFYWWTQGESAAQNGGGFWWSMSSYDYDNAWRLISDYYQFASGVLPKDYGFSLRCVNNSNLD